MSRLCFVRYLLYQKSIKRPNSNMEKITWKAFPNFKQIQCQSSDSISTILVVSVKHFYGFQKYFVCSQRSFMVFILLAWKLPFWNMKILIFWSIWCFPKSCNYLSESNCKQFAGFDEFGTLGSFLFFTISPFPLSKIVTIKPEDMWYQG